MALLGRLILGERLAWFQAGGIFLAAFGVLLEVTCLDPGQPNLGKIGNVEIP
jgi:drug/metabolite transporter (DMT)-like permease